MSSTEEISTDRMRTHHRWLLAAFSKRITGDYGIEADITADDARVLIDQAREFLEASKQLLTKAL